MVREDTNHGELRRLGLAVNYFLGVAGGKLVFHISE